MKTARKLSVAVPLFLLFAAVLAACGGGGGSGASGTPDITVTDSVSPAADLQVAFGSVTVGATSDQTVTIKNDGTSDLILGTAGGADSLAAPFGMTADNCSGQTLFPAAHCIITVRFAPTGTGSFTDSFDIPSNDPDENPVTVSVSGFGTATLVANIAVTDSVDPVSDLKVPFGSLTVGSASEQTVTVTNSGTANLMIGAIGSVNPLGNPFALTTDTCSGQTLAPAATCTINVRFAPTGTGSFTDNFDIPSNDPDATSTEVNVSGTGTTVPTPHIAVTDSVMPADDLKIDFGSVNAGDAVSQTVTVTNNGDADLDIGNIGQNYPITGPFTITGDQCSGSTLIPSKNCVLTVRFAPTGPGSFSSSFDIPSNDAGGSVVMAVSGTGVEAPVPLISVSSSQLSFGTVTTNSTLDQNITITNSGNAYLVIGTIASIDPLNAPFSVVSDGCSGQTISAHLPGASCLMTVRFAPVLAGSYTDSFDIPSNDPNTSDLTVNVSGSSGYGTVSGTITLPSPVAEKCYFVAISTTSTGSPFAFVTGQAGGLSIIYSIEDVPVGQYYLYAGVDNDASSASSPTCSFTNSIPTSGDFVGFFGGVPPPVTPNVTVNPGGNTFNFSLLVY